MQPFIVLSTAFVFLVSFLEWHHPAPQGPKPYTMTMAVVRDQPVAVERAVAPPANPASTTPQTREIAKTSATHKPRPLDLRLPASTKNEKSSLNIGNAAFSDLFESRGNTGVSYDAELVYDRQTGEDITGGKVNIKIPLT